MHANAGWTTYEVGTILFALHALETLKIHCRGSPVGSFHQSPMDGRAAAATGLVAFNPIQSQFTY